MIAALFVRADSVYKTMPGVDAWDIERDARKWPGGCPVVVHPPCRSWGRLRQFAKPRDDEKELGPWAVTMVRRWGGVLEHPAESTLFAHCRMPRPGQFPDDFGGYTIEVNQFHFGHRAEKATWLHIVGVDPDDLPPIPVREGSPFGSSTTLTKPCAGLSQTDGRRCPHPTPLVEQMEGTPMSDQKTTPERPVDDEAVRGADSVMQAAEQHPCIAKGCRYALNREGIALRCVVGCYATMKEGIKR